MGKQVLIRETWYKIASGPAVRCLHAAAQLPGHHDKLGHFASRCHDLPRGCVVTHLADGCDPPFLMIEHMAADPLVPAATWLVSQASETALRLEALVGELRLELLAEGPPDRVLAQLQQLSLATAALTAAAS